MARRASAPDVDPAAPDTERPSARALLARLARKNARHALFCRALVTDPSRNATEAYLAAFPDASRDSACARGSALMRRPEIVAAVEALDLERIDRVAPEFEVSADRTLREIARLALADIRQVVTWKDGVVEVKDSAAIGDDAAAGIASVEYIPTQHGTRIKVKLNDKPAALRMLGDHIPGFWAKQQVEHSGTVTLAELLAPPKEPG